MDSLPSRDTPHPRDTLMNFSQLPEKRRSPGRVTSPPSVTRPDLQRVPRKMATRSMKNQHVPLKMAEPRTPKQHDRNQPFKRKRGRPAKTVATGMTKNTFVKKCKELNRVIDPLKKGLLHLPIVPHN
jgi:hypothetical protein